MRKVEGQAARMDRDECLPGVLVIERDPVPDIHERTERKAEDEAECCEREPSLEQSRRHRAGDPAGSPAEHLPWGPCPLAKEEVRNERGQRADREPAARSE